MFPVMLRQHEVIKRGCLLLLSHKEFMQDLCKSLKSQKLLKPNKGLIIHNMPALHREQTVQVSSER